MEVKLVIRDTKDEDSVNVIGKEYVFNDASVISIGRGEPNDVPLTDPGRTVSRNHIQLIASSNGYALQDLESKNFSFVNEERMSSDAPRKLMNGDMIRLGDFSLEYFCVVPSEDLDVTILDPVFTAPDYSKDNPFDDAVKQMVQSWGNLIQLYESEGGEDKKAYMNYALKKELPAIEDSSVLNMFLNLVSDTQIAESTHVPTLPVEKEQIENKQVENKIELPTLAGQSSETGPVILVLDTALASLKQLIRIPYEFRGEFIGHTMWQDEESTFLYEGDYEVTKNYLLDTAEDAAVGRKLDRLKKAAEKVTFHQIGMMEGYKAVVKEGLDQIMKEIDPEELENQFMREGFLYKLLPSLASKKVLAELKTKLASIKQSDWGVLEQRVYRPVFIRAYMAEISKSE